MRNILLVLSMLVCICGSAQVNPNNHWVDGYYKSDGSYVQGHYRTDPNHTVRDNYSTYPNYNPYTGVQGQKYRYGTLPPTYQYTTEYNYPREQQEIPEHGKRQQPPVYWIDAAGNKHLLP